MNSLSSRLISLSVFAGTASFVTGAMATELQEIIVSADFRGLPVMSMPASLTVVDDQRIADRAAQHLEEILNIAPNVNFAAGASRGRFLQIRGIGERSQFVDPINPSVGVTIDDVDFSAIGNAGMLFDIDQVEILRGPQGTRFGASALAGMVNMRSKVPTDSFEARISSGYGNYDTWNTGAVISGPLTEGLLGRLAVQQNRSDGFIENTYLGRDDTNDRDEFSARGKLRWLASDDLSVDATLFYVNVDNGYDAFSLDNTRETLSDEPGRDRQETGVVSLKTVWDGLDVATLEITASREQSNLAYGYDEDWTYSSICDGLACEGWAYSSTDNYLRDRDSNQLDIRLVSKPGGELFGNSQWVAGVYYQGMDVDLDRHFFDWDLYAPAIFTSEYQTDNLAVYGQIQTALTEELELTVGGRFEQFDGDYTDSRAVAANPDENLWGGEISLRYQVSDRTMVYGLLSRGYKAGGVNGEALGKAEKNDFDQTVIDFLEQRLTFATESANNLELGLKGRYANDRLQLRLAAFYMDRNDVQLKGWYNEGPLFVGYIDNGASGVNYGLELETAFQANDRLSMFAGIGLLETGIQDFQVLVGNALVDKSGRDQAHAPGYQFNLGAEIALLDNLVALVEVEGKDSFYFSDSHDQQSGSYELLHARLTYRLDALELSAWGRNLTDENYPVRGFYFPNDPREFYTDDRAYIQLGDPRTYGVSASYTF